MPRHPWIALLVLSGLVMGGCGGDGGETGTDPGATPSITISVSPNALSVVAGQSATATVTIGRVGGYQGTISLSGVAPTGVTLSLAPASVPAGATTSTLTITAAASMAAGTHTVHLQAYAPAVESKSTALSLSVTAPAGGGYALGISPASVSVQPGQSATATVNIARSNGFTGAVGLSVSGAPAGISAAVAPTSVTGTTATLTLSASASTAPGTYMLSVHGTATGAPNQSASLAVQVTQATGGTGLRWSFCASAAPIWLAYQDGSSPWTQLQVSPGASVAIPIQSRGGVAFVQHTGGGIVDVYTLVVYYATAAELGAYADWCSTYGAGKTVSGSVAGLGQDDAAYVALGRGAAFAPAAEPTFTLAGVADGPHDLISSRQRGQTGADELIFRRGLDPGAGATLPVLDFGSAEAFAPETHSVTIANQGPDDAGVTLAYLTANGTNGILSSGAESPSTKQSFPAVPAAHQQAGDLHELIVSASVSGRSALTFFHGAADRTLTLGPSLSVPNVSIVASAPYVRLRLQLARQPEYDDQVTLLATNGTRVATLSATAAYFGGAPTIWDLTIPDLTSAGLDANWGPQAAAPAFWTASAFGWGATGLPLLAPTDGLTVQTAARGGVLVP